MILLSVMMMTRVPPGLPGPPRKRNPSRISKWTRTIRIWMKCSQGMTGIITRPMKVIRTAEIIPAVIRETAVIPAAVTVETVQEAALREAEIIPAAAVPEAEEAEAAPAEVLREAAIPEAAAVPAVTAATAEADRGAAPP